MNRLKELRNQKGLTLDDIEAQTGIKRGTYSNYENSKTEPKLATWQKLADFFEVPVTYLQGISNNRRSITEFDDLEDWLKAVNETIVDKNGNTCAEADELKAVGTEGVLYDFYELFNAVFNFRTGSLGMEFKKLIEKISSVADLSEISDNVSEVFKMGIKAKSGDEKAAKSFEEISKVVDKYLGVDEWDDEPTVIEKEHKGKN